MNIICPNCSVNARKSSARPLRSNTDPYYDEDNNFIFQQKDVFYDEEGFGHTHLLYLCSNKHKFYGPCEAIQCIWGNECKAFKSDTLLPPPVLIAPPQ